MTIEITEQARGALFKVIAEGMPEKLGMSEEERITLGLELSQKPKK